MTWVLIIWSALISISAIAGGASNDCGSPTTQSAKDACEAGTGIGVAAILFDIGFIGFVRLSLIWLMTPTKGRDCAVAAVKRSSVVRRKSPHCGEMTSQPPPHTPAGNRGRQ